jgi:hypothetical protein
MENEAIADEILALLEQLLQVAGPEGTLEFLQVGLEEMSGMGGEMPPEMMSQGGPQAMPPMAQQRPRNALAGV